jgi:hypothetical protein
MSSAADTLRRAAEVLRERAEAATPGPWEPYVLGSEGYDVRGPRTERLRPTRVARLGYQQWGTDKANAAYIATVDPTFGLTVAEALDTAGEALEDGYRMDDMTARLLTSIALAILQDQP